jgi:RNA polymerase sigma factor (sigma-70 family)
MEEKYSDVNIIDGLKEGNYKVLEFLYCQYRDEVILYVTRNSGSVKDAEEVLHEAIIRTYRAVNKQDFHLRKTFKSYFSSIYHNTWINSAKIKNKKLPYFELTNSIELNIKEEDEELRYEFLNNLIQEKLILLGDNCRKVLTMYYYEEKSMSEIAYIMEYKNVQIAKNKKYKCLEYLKKIVNNNNTIKKIFEYEQ